MLRRRRGREQSTYGLTGIGIRSSTGTSGTTDIGPGRRTRVLTGLTHDTTDGCSSQGIGRAIADAGNTTTGGMATASAITLAMTTTRAKGVARDTGTATDEERSLIRKRR